MEISNFVKGFADQFDETDVNEFKADTIFHELDEWSSMSALAIIAFVDEEYQVKISGDDIRTSETIKDVFNIVEARKK